MSLPQWKGLFDWSMKYQDGTRPAQWDSSEYDPEKMRWLEGVLKHYMQDFAARMAEIKTALDTGMKPAASSSSSELQQGAAAEPAAAAGGAEGAAAAGQQQQQPGDQQALSLAEKEQLLEELMEIVDSIDYARDLHKIGGLPTLLSVLQCQYPSLRWRAAEVVATCMQNNLPVQQWFLDGGVLPPLLALLRDEAFEAEATVLLRTKGMLALSALVRHHNQALEAFRQAGGVTQLAGLTQHADTRVSRKALALLRYCVSQVPSDAGVAVEAGAVAGAKAALQAASSTSDAVDGDVRCAALGFLCQLAATDAQAHAAVKGDSSLQEQLQALRSRLSAADDATSSEDEAAAIDRLQQALAGAPPAASSAAQGQQASDAAGQGQQGGGQVLLLGAP